MNHSKIQISLSVNFIFLLSFLAMLCGCHTTMQTDSKKERREKQAFVFSDLPEGKMRDLVENCFCYINPEHGIIDPLSGYPCEGWNNDPEKGLFLRDFTQLTAIGFWIETLANIAAGYADNPFISRYEALKMLSKTVDSLLEDQSNPELSSDGLLVNFISLEGGKRKGPLQESIEKNRFIEEFGAEGEEIWRALLQIGWIIPEKNGTIGKIKRTNKYGHDYFDGPLTQYSEKKIKDKIMNLIDERTVTIVFCDNANLSASIAKAIGALLTQREHNPTAKNLIEKMENFLDAQQRGYENLFDSESACIAFGFDARKKRFLGWDDADGNWVYGKMDYLINEFREPWIFVCARFTLPSDALENASFKIKPYRDRYGNDIYGLCSWHGSAFQFFGFTPFLDESPAWQKCLENLLDAELDHCEKNNLPGFLSESYTGNGTEYNGYVGIKELAITDKPLNQYSASLYSLGAAYQISSAKVEPFIEENWKQISLLLTDHGPWEGFNILHSRLIQFQTTPHTLALLLAGIGKSKEHMQRYLKYKNLQGQIKELYEEGNGINLLETKTVTWSADGSPVLFQLENNSALLKASLKDFGGVSFLVPNSGANISGTHLKIKYKSKFSHAAKLSFKHFNKRKNVSVFSPIEIFVNIKGGDQVEELIITLPSTPALRNMTEVAFVLGGKETETISEIKILEFSFAK